MKILISKISILAFLILIGGGLYAQGTPPAGAPSAVTNTEGPVNVSSTSQTKTGGLSVGALSVNNTVYVKGNSTTGSPSGNTTLEVEKNIGASQYCNQDAGVCFTAAEMATLIGGG